MWASSPYYDRVNKQQEALKTTHVYVIYSRACALCVLLEHSGPAGGSAARSSLANITLVAVENASCPRHFT